MNREELEVDEMHDLAPREMGAEVNQRLREGRKLGLSYATATAELLKEHWKDLPNH